MSENTSSAIEMSSDGEVFANDYQWRSTKAKQQLRDRFGRWISMGANVKFQADGQAQSGIVTSVVDGKAYIQQRNPDGTTTKRIMSADALRVIASKATLPPDGSRIQDPNNNFAAAAKTPEFQKALKDHGQAVIQRADGYALAANLVDKAQGLDNTPNNVGGPAQGNDNNTIDPSQKPPTQKDPTNPIAYQLFAPGGRSLGQYTDTPVAEFDDMVADDKGSVESNDSAPSGAADAPSADSAPVVASVEVSGDDKPYRVPEAVRAEIASAIERVSNISDDDLATASRLANDPAVGLDEVRWIYSFFADIDAYERFHGGFRGRRWASKIVDPDTGIETDLDPQIPDERYEFDTLSYDYFAVGDMVGSTIVARLIAVDYDNNVVFEWTTEGFTPLGGTVEEIDEPVIIPIDEGTALALAHWIDEADPEESGWDITDADPEERNLFTLAAPELDFDEIDRAAEAILAAAGDGVYTPAERSQNAKVQRRAAGGRFGSGGNKEEQQGGQDTAPKQTVDQQAGPAGGSTEKKATLPVELPLVPDVKARIAQWLTTAAEAPVVAAGDPAPAAPSQDPGYTEADAAAEDSSTGPTDEAIYFAIVDDVDKTAVLDIVAIVKQNGQPSAFVRSKGQWTASPDYLAKLQGAAPPPVVELPDPETVKNVIEQIDQHDSGGDSQSAQDEAPQPGEVPIAASAFMFAMEDGSLPIITEEDLAKAVTASAGTLPERAHIRKRATALNRLDLVPSEWRSFTLAEIGELSDMSNSMYGPYGEVITAGGVPGVADTPGDLRAAHRLKVYWTRGKGALKIRWGTKGDLTRAHRHLAKYVGPDRAWGLAQEYHKSIFHVSNTTHDKATGQYVHHHHKKYKK